jgi:hypothetical protein
MAKLSARESVLAYVCKYGRFSTLDSNLTTKRRWAADKLVKAGILTVENSCGEDYDYVFDPDVWDSTFPG